MNSLIEDAARSVGARAQDRPGRPRPTRSIGARAQGGRGQERDARSVGARAQRRSRARNARSTGARAQGAYWFDREAAERAERFFAEHLQHVKGEWAGKPFVLARWQRDKIIRPLFGWKRADGTRRYRKAYIEIPRKAGKSTLAAGIALHLLFSDGEAGAEIYSAAADREQAAIVFELAQQMVEANPRLRERAEVFRRSIVAPKLASSYKVLSSDAFTKHGLNAHGIVFDELHVQPNRELWDVLTTSVGARRQPLVVAITTAGYDRESICWEQHEHARQVIEGIVRDDELLAVIYAADPEDDWTRVSTWRKAHPGIGVTLSKQFLRGECRLAKATPGYQNAFRRLYLNQWTQQETRYIPMERWDQLGEAVDAAELAGQACYGGLDLASTTDIAALVLMFPAVNGGSARALPFFWIPAENMRERVLRDRVPYDVWVREGLIEATEGNVIDYAAIRGKLLALKETYNIREIAFDRWGATQLSQELDAAGLTVVPTGQGFASMSAPTKELLNLIMAGKLAHGGNPVLRWMADNMVVRQDPAGNVKPDKSKSTQRIDGMVALIMAIDRLSRQGGAKPSVYETRGVRVITA